MLDLKFIRQNPQQFDTSMQKRKADYSSGNILKLDDEKKAQISKMQILQSKRNQLAKEIAMAKKNGQNTEDLMQNSISINKDLKEIEQQINQDQVLQDLLEQIPNILDESVPQGNDENDNIEVEKFLEPQKFDFDPLEHHQIGENLNLLDFTQSVKISGSRFSTLYGHLAKLERALSNFMLDLAQKNGFIETSPPYLVKDHAMFGSGQLPKFSDDAFKTTDGYWLIPTSEVSLVNLVNDKMLKEEELPLRFAAYTPCFRKEAGSAGKDMHGMIRQHQFKKVELVTICSAEKSVQEHELMSQTASDVLKQLKLPYRKMILCSGDTGFSASKTYDLEVWLPGQNQYREISSCSNCLDFQARRLKGRYKTKDGKKNYVHTLNGSSLAVGRTIIAIIENYQQKDGSIKIPDALIPYMSGQEIINKK